MPALVETAVVRRHDPSSGDWAEVRSDGRRIVVASGGTGNRLDPGRRVRRSGWEIRRIGDQLELLSTWPVPELVTHRIGEHVAQLGDDVARAGGTPDQDLAAVTDAVAALLDEGGPAGPAPLDALLWARAYPLLRVPIEQGAHLDAVPVALDQVLRAADARRAARRAFGRVTRPLVRALATSLLPAPDGRVPFEPALLALMASPWCEPEQLTELLGRQPHRPGAVAFDVGEVDRARSMFEGVSSRRIATRLGRALTEPDGLRTLATDLATWVPPSSEPRPGPARPARAPAAVLAPPARTDVPLRHPPALQAVDGLEVGHRRLVLPRTADELVEWGAVLDNCLGGFRHAVAAERTHVLGVVVGGRLRWAVEVTRAGVLRQFEGAGNRQAPEHVAQPVLAALRSHGIVRADGRRGYSLMAPR
ncbi:hypothetical protein NHL50_07645 [Acidimicrobiia bacterium EGI L10123]|uniref:hypothetical protein n=1 Tax=Salinilacustrithrix flava TaxID=2957203 RepID=UPI003D7C171F|nr:hypothetical protein [Acidimicrobiia bacterium EGI L10123]